MANLKNIVDLPVAESAEGLNLIVNDNGAAKQIAADAICKVKSVNGAQPDENGNVQIDTASSWNDLRDKPFYSEMETFVLAENVQLEWVVEDEAYHRELTVERGFAEGDKVTAICDGVAHEAVVYAEDDMFCADFWDADVFAFIVEGRYVDGNFWVHIGSGESMNFESITVTRETVHKLDAKYLPDMGGGHWVLVDYTGDHGIVTASDGIFEALKNFLDNGVCTPVAVYMRSLIDGKVVIWSHCVEDILWMSDNIAITTEIRHDFGLVVYIYPNGEHAYYLE